MLRMDGARVRLGRSGRCGDGDGGAFEDTGLPFHALEHLLG